MSFAIVFPGQGSQSTGMQAQLAARYDEVRRTWNEAGEALDLDLWGIAQSGPDERLNDTTITQPAMLAAERLEVLDGTRPNRARIRSTASMSQPGLILILMRA